jgi:uridine kinase
MILGICGGTGSGKTTVAERLAQALGPDQALLLAQDAYYKDSGHLPFEERVRQNFDHPDAVDFELLIHHVETLRRQLPVQQPSYDFSAHVRRQETTRVDSRAVVIVEGILIFQNSRLRSLFDLKIFVDTDADVRLIRRLRRDIRDRGRSLDSVVQQYLETVRPMHQEFVEPGRRFADIVIPEGGKNDAAMEMLVQWLATKVQGCEKSLL